MNGQSGIKDDIDFGTSPDCVHLTAVSASNLLKQRPWLADNDRGMEHMPIMQGLTRGFSIRLVVLEETWMDLHARVALVGERDGYPVNIVDTWIDYCT